MLTPVAPFAGAWIEMNYQHDQRLAFGSLPSRERGLKLMELDEKFCDVIVAPFAGAWIEIGQVDSWQQFSDVAPFAGAWIEIIRTWSALERSYRRSLRGSVD